MKHILLAIVMWSVAAQSWAAITIDTSSHAEAAVGTPNTLTYNHTLAADSNAIMVCLAERDTNASGYTVNTATVTIGGASATQVIGQFNGVSIRSVMFIKTAPATGVQSIVVNGDTGTDRLVVVAVSLKLVAQSSTLNTATGTGTTGATNLDINGIASAVGEFVFMCGAIRTATVTPSPDATAPISTEIDDYAHTDGTSVRAFAYWEDGATTSIDMRVDASASADWAGVAVSIRPQVLSQRRREVLWFQ